MREQQKGQHKSSEAQGGKNRRVSAPSTSDLQFLGGHGLEEVGKDILQSRDSGNLKGETA